MIRIQQLERQISSGKTSTYTTISATEPSETGFGAALHSELLNREGVDAYVLGRVSVLGEYIDRSVSTVLGSKNIHLVAFRSKKELVGLTFSAQIRREILSLHILDSQESVLEQIFCAVELGRTCACIEIDISHLLASKIEKECTAAPEPVALTASEAQFEASGTLFRAGHVEDAIISGFEDAAKTDENSQRMLDLVINYLRHAAYADAVLLLDVVLQARPENHDLYYIRAIAQKEMGSVEAARESLGILLEQYPDHQQGQQLLMELGKNPA